MVIDLTHIMESGMPIFPGSPEVMLEKLASLDSDGYNETYLKLSSHTGTHIDCGYHLLENGFDTASVSPEVFIGEGLIIDCRGIKKSGIIHKAHLVAFQDKIKQTDFILLHTGWSHFWGKEDYLMGFPALDLEAARYLSDFALKGVGVDAISFDPPDSKNFPVHKLLLSAGFVLIENLTHIENLPTEGFFFSCLPLKIKHGDGSPVRAVGILRDDKSLKK